MAWPKHLELDLDIPAVIRLGGNTEIARSIFRISKLVQRRSRVIANGAPENRRALRGSCPSPGCTKIAGATYSDVRKNKSATTLPVKGVASGSTPRSGRTFVALSKQIPRIDRR